MNKDDPAVPTEQGGCVSGWPEDRRIELARLQTLLWEVSSINSGNHSLERIARCIAIADELMEWDWTHGTGRCSFLHFLTEQAAVAKTQQPNAPEQS